MITRVSHLQEALQRFSPDARLKPEIDVHGISPSTQCTVETVGGINPETLESKIEQLETAAEDDAERIGELHGALKSVLNLFVSKNKPKDIIEEATQIARKVL